MARRVAVSVENNFKGGLITETTGLNFPENACTETFDCIHDEKGRITRRPGFEYELGYEVNNLAVEDDVVSGFTWTNVEGDGSVSLRVQQMGSKLYFYNISSGSALSDSLVADTVNLSTYVSDSSVDPGLNECQYAAGNGFLIVTHPQVEPLHITYNSDTGAITETAITMYIRDLEGLDDGLDDNERPTASIGTLTDEHKYNLFNQGWYYNTNAALTAWDTARTDMPSNADVWWLFKDTSGAFDAAQVANVDPGLTKAPRGHYVLNLFSQDRTTASGVTGITTVTTGRARFTTCASMGGRMFYSGLNASGFSSKIYFSQIIESADQVGLLHQRNDPTSEELSDLLPSDGGWVHILGMESCIKLFALANVLLVFGTNGIWAITGSEGLGFSATDFTVTKISSIGSSYHSSFVDVDGFPYWWNLDGIYKIIPSGGAYNEKTSTTAQSGGFDVISLSNYTIRSEYSDIPAHAKRSARGAYNPLDKIVRWIYKSEDSTDIDDDYIYDRVLSYNLLTEAFYIWRMPADHAVRVHDIFLIRGEGGTAGSESVVELDAGTWTALDNIEIQDSTGDVVTTFIINRSLIEPVFKFFVSATNATNNRDFTFAETRNTTSYKDWIVYDTTGTTFTSTFTTGYKIHGETQRFFQSNYVFVFLEQETNASCYMQGLWEWTTSSAEGRWSTSQQIYNSAQTNRAVNFRRLKVRGKGRALQLKFTSDAATPFTIVGWSIFETQNASI